MNFRHLFNKASDRKVALIVSKGKQGSCASCMIKIKKICG